jgi:hypothetical protein
MASLGSFTIVTVCAIDMVAYARGLLVATFIPRAVAM